MKNKKCKHNILFLLPGYIWMLSQNMQEENKIKNQNADLFLISENANRGEKSGCMGRR